MNAVLLLLLAATAAGLLLMSAPATAADIEGGPAGGGDAPGQDPGGLEAWLSAPLFAMPTGQGAWSGSSSPEEISPAPGGADPGDANLDAFLEMLRLGEGTSDAKGFRRLVGGGEFDSFAMHPGENKAEFPPGGARSFRAGGFYYRPLDSTAAGAYQFTLTTWKSLQQRFPGRFPDFTPQTQREGAVQRIIDRGALQDVLQGRLNTAIGKCNKEWASLPGAPYGQRTESLASVRSVYQNNGGTIA